MDLQFKVESLVEELTSSLLDLMITGNPQLEDIITETYHKEIDLFVISGIYVLDLSNTCLPNSDVRFYNFTITLRDGDYVTICYHNKDYGYSNSVAAKLEKPLATELISLLK